MNLFRLMCIAAVVLMQACAGDVSRGQEKPSPAAQKIKNSKTLSWTVTIYERSTSRDGQRSWLRAIRSNMDHRAPDRYRDTRYDAEGNITSVEIVDIGDHESLRIDMGSKTALYLNQPTNVYGLGGPLEMLARLVEKKPDKPVAERIVNDEMADVHRFRSMDVWINQKTGQVVGLSIPGADRFDPTTVPDRDNPPEKTMSRKRMLGQIRSDIVYNPPLDEALFSMVPPEGFDLVEAPPGPAINLQE